MNAQSIIEKAKNSSRTLLNEIESKMLLSEAGIPVVETKLATSKQEAIAISKKFGFPVALKIAFTMAGAAISFVGSPTDFAPNGPAGSAVSSTEPPIASVSNRS